jgi:excisionase family DNA binding protein
MKKDKLITCVVAAQMLGFSADYIRRLCLSGEIKAEKMGKTWIMTHAAIKNIKRQRQTKNKEV